MLASQLLRILHTLPSDAERENRVLELLEKSSSLKENRNVKVDNSKSFGNESSDSLIFGSKEKYQLDDSIRDTDPLPFELNGEKERWKANFDDGVLEDIESIKEDQNGSEAYTFSFQTKDKEEEIEDFTHCNDNNLLECESPELMVCYKEINYHIVEDICIDEETPVDDNILFESHENGPSRLSSSSESPNGSSDSKATGGVESEFSFSNGLPENANGIYASDSPNEEAERNGKIYAHMPKSPSESSVGKDTDKDSNPEDFIEAVEPRNGKFVSGDSKERSFVNRKLPMQEFGTRSFLRSFLGTFDIEGDTVFQPTNEIHLGNATPESPTAPSSPESEPNEHSQPTKISYNSKVERGSITFDFKSKSKSSTTAENTNNDPIIDELQIPHHEHSNSSNVIQTQFYEGESSFSGSGLITYTEAISSGSLSHRSDESTTSARSFVFPVLQAEWSRSPARMAEANRKHLAKKGWKSGGGLLCCRFSNPKG